MPSVKEREKEVKDELSRLESLTKEYEGRLNFARNEIANLKAQKEQAANDFEKTKADIEDYKRKSFAEIEKKEQDAEFRLKAVSEKELALKEGVVRMNMEQAKLNGDKDRLATGSKNVEVFHAKVKAFVEIVAGEFEKIK